MNDTDIFLIKFAFLVLLLILRYAVHIIFAFSHGNLKNAMIMTVCSVF